MFAKEFLLKKKYELQCRIGEGTYATVYRARRLIDSEIVAVKVINVFKMDKKKIENALNEVRIICAIDHPNVVGYHEAFLDEKNKDLYIIMEYVGGGDMNDRIKFLNTNKTFLPEETVWKYAIQILQALKALHDRKIIHRDIKPGNIFVSADLSTIKLGDLNVSKIMRHRSMTATVIGTPYYLAPEIWKNAMYDYRCDVFSFGCVLYEIAALQVPFQGSSISELFKKIEYGTVPFLPKRYSNHLYNFIKLCLTKSFKNRPMVEKLLSDPRLMKFKHKFRHLVYDDRKDNKKYLKDIQVDDIDKLKQILPSLKNNRSSSMKCFGGVQRSFDKGSKKTKEFQNFSVVHNSRNEDSMSFNSKISTKFKDTRSSKQEGKKNFDSNRESELVNSKRRKKTNTEFSKYSKRKLKVSRNYEARKNYSKFLKNQRKKKEQKKSVPKEDLVTKPPRKNRSSIRSKKSISTSVKKGPRKSQVEEPKQNKHSIRPIIKEVKEELAGTWEIDMESSELGDSHQDLIEIMDGITSKRNKTNTKKNLNSKTISKKKLVSQNVKEEKSCKCDSQLSNKTSKTNKKVFDLSTSKKEMEVLNKRTKERKKSHKKSISLAPKKVGRFLRVRSSLSTSKNQIKSQTSSQRVRSNKEMLKSECFSSNRAEETTSKVRILHNQDLVFEKNVSHFSSIRENNVQMDPHNSINSQTKESMIQSERVVSKNQQSWRVVENEKKPVNNLKVKKLNSKRSINNKILNFPEPGITKVNLSSVNNQYDTIQEMPEQEITTDRMGSQKRRFETQKSKQEMLCFGSQREVTGANAIDYTNFGHKDSKKKTYKKFSKRYSKNLGKGAKSEKNKILINKKKLRPSKKLDGKIYQKANKRNSKMKNLEITIQKKPILKGQSARDINSSAIQSYSSRHESNKFYKHKKTSRKIQTSLIRNKDSTNNFKKKSEKIQNRTVIPSYSTHSYVKRRIQTRSKAKKRQKGLTSDNLTMKYSEKKAKRQSPIFKKKIKSEIGYPIRGNKAININETITSINITQNENEGYNDRCFGSMENFENKNILQGNSQTKFNPTLTEKLPTRLNVSPETVQQEEGNYTKTTSQSDLLKKKQAPNNQSNFIMLNIKKNHGKGNNTFNPKPIKSEQDVTSRNLKESREGKSRNETSLMAKQSKLLNNDVQKNKIVKAKVKRFNSRASRKPILKKGENKYLYLLSSKSNKGEGKTLKVNSKNRDLPIKSKKQKFKNFGTGKVQKNRLTEPFGSTRVIKYRPSGKNED